MNFNYSFKTFENFNFYEFVLKILLNVKID